MLKVSTALFVPSAITITKSQLLSAQAQAPKAAVEFDQAINYVNKIKVMHGPDLSFEKPCLAVRFLEAQPQLPPETIVARR